MSRLEKSLARLQRNPRPKDFMWDELEFVLSHHNFTLQPSGSGSGRKFLHTNGYPLSLHKRHPTPYLKVYEVVAAVKALKDTGEIK